jgi:hypothetical protein
MGYSPQKTPFDLTDFLSKPGHPKSRKWQRFSMASRPAKTEPEADTSIAADVDDVAES